MLLPKGSLRNAFIKKIIIKQHFRNPERFHRERYNKLLLIILLLISRTCHELKV